MDRSRDKGFYLFIHLEKAVVSLPSNHFDPGICLTEDVTYCNYL